MAKKIFAIFFVSILLCSYIIPTTSVFADVVIGDNDSIVVTQQGLENGKKIATMEAMLQLLESGASEINFNDISDLDDYLEDFYDELSNINYQDVSNELLAGAYNDVKSLKQWIDDRGEFIATYYKDYLNSADQGLTDIFNHFNLKLEKTSLTRTPLNGVRGMSRFNNSEPTPVIPPDYVWYINQINTNTNSINSFYWRDYPQLAEFQGGYNYQSVIYPYYNYSWFAPSNYSQMVPIGINANDCNVTCGDITDIYIYSNNDNYSYNVTVHPVGNICYQTWNGAYNNCILPRLNVNNNEYYTGGNTPMPSSYSHSYTGSLLGCLQDILTYFRNVNIYVDDNPWSIIGQSNPPTLDIDGFITMYGNDQPVEYEFPQGTQIDYNALYTTIYNAIRDNLPLDMQTINNNQVYYDSHDNVYSPTIYNYYGKDGDDENDWIDSILDYATIPDFNSALGTVAVLDTPFVNGITIVNAGVTDVIPSDILLIFGGFFVLVLFVCIINRMSE